MSNNDDKDRWETFCKLYDKLSSKEEMRELFEEEIKCFSLYLSHVNQDYVYNATFLPQFNDDFWNFLCAFNKKYKIVEELFDAAKKYYNVTLKIDRYWMMTVDEKGNIKKSTLSGVDYICEKSNYTRLDNLDDSERNIYSIKSNASSRLMSIKFDKILLRLADLLDMSSYRVSKPILYHNMEQMSEESAFHWISHLLTQGYKLRTKYEIGSSKSSGTDNEESLENIEGVLVPQTITEKLILEIPVDISQMSTIECENPCRKVQIGNISRQEITLICGEGCQNKSNEGLENRCNFLCRWFCVKNDYLIKELVALKEYLNRNKNNYFKCEIEIKIKCNNKTSIEARQFEILNHYIQDRK